MGAALAVMFASGKRRIRAGASIVLAVAVLTTLFVPEARLTHWQLTIRNSPLPHAHFEDTIASVDVVGGPPRHRRLLINGYWVTYLTIDTRLLIYFPKVLRPHASYVLVVCLGMGTTYRSSIILGMHTDVVELDPTVPRVMPWFYPDASKYLHSPLGHVIVADGRNYVRLTNKHYDIIVEDAPPPVWSAGTVVLLTREFDQEAQQRLTSRGILAVFYPNISYQVTAILLRTFESVFRYVMRIRAPRSAAGFYLIGSQRPLEFHTATIEGVFGTKSAQADLAGAPDYPPVPAKKWPLIIRGLVRQKNRQEVASYAGKGPILTDDHPLTEYYLFQHLGITPPIGP
jgi:predicted membrane-bound spermidine synthase